MAPRGEILDSDEEDNEFSPAQSRGASPQPVAAGTDELDTPRNRRAESTDPSFFRDVYDDQQVAEAAHQASSSVAALSNDPVSTFATNPPPNLSHLGDQNELSHLSSITDPGLTSHRRLKKSVMSAAVDLTQVTTPGRPTPSVPADIWDFPASQDDAPAPVPQAASTKKKIILKLKKPEKRKSALSSSITSPEQLSSGVLPTLSVTQAEQPTLEPQPKKRKISSSGEAPLDTEEVDLLVIPRSEDKPASKSNFVTPTTGENSSSIVEDSTKRDEYKFVSLESEADGNHGPAGLATPAMHLEDLQKSSGNATIKYPTPSEFASSGRGILSPGDYGTASSSRPRRRRNVTVADSPPSSPDIISAPLVTPREKGGSEDLATEANDPYLAPSSPPPQSGRGRRKGKSAVDAALSPDVTVAEDDPPRPSGRIKIMSRKRQVHDLTASSPPAADQGDLAATLPGTSEQVVPQVKSQTIQEKLLEKKRGRKSKDVPSEVLPEQSLPDTAPQQAQEEPATVEEPVEIPAEPVDMPVEPPTKKRRGRPKKEQQSETLVVEDYSPPPTKKKRGRPKKSDVAQVTEPEVPVDDKDGMTQLDKQGHEERDNVQHVTAGKAGKRADIRETSADEEVPTALSERDSNSNMGASPTKPTTTTTPTTTTDAADKAAKENKLVEVTTKKEEVKPATPSSQGKVPYRVGLSRRSRIAPLLKSFRK